MLKDVRYTLKVFLVLECILKINEGYNNFSPATVTLKALSTKTVMSKLANALVNQMWLARNATSVLASTMDSLHKDAR